MYHVYIAMSDLHRVHAIDGAGLTLVRTLDVITISKASELLLPDFYVAGSFPKEMLRGYWPRFKMRFRRKKCLPPVQSLTIIYIFGGQLIQVFHSKNCIFAALDPSLVSPGQRYPRRWKSVGHLHHWRFGFSRANLGISQQSIWVCLKIVYP